jgi:hypothetical protein
VLAARHARKGQLDTEAQGRGGRGAGSRWRPAASRRGRSRPPRRAGARCRRARPCPTRPRAVRRAGPAAVGDTPAVHRPLDLVGGGDEAVGDPPSATSTVPPSASAARAACSVSSARAMPRRAARSRSPSSYGPPLQATNLTQRVADGSRRGGRSGDVERGSSRRSGGLSSARTARNEGAAGSSPAVGFAVPGPSAQPPARRLGLTC